MGFATFLNSEFLTQNPKIRQVLSDYDSNAIDKKTINFQKKKFLFL